jgi:hypothetical protein
MNHRSRSSAITVVASALMLVVPAVQAAKPGFDGDGPCVWSGKYKDWVYQERQLITTYTRPLDLQQAKELVPPPFQLAENPRVRISMLDLYEMAVGPPYKEAEVSLLATHKGETGWYIVYLPVTDSDACGAGVKNEGFPKVVRKVTVERSERSFAGTLFTPGGELPEFTFRLAYEDAVLTDAVRADVSELSQYPSYTTKDGVVYRFPGYPRSAHHLGSAMPGTFEVRFGRPEVVVIGMPSSVLRRLAIAPPEYGFWLKMRARYRLNPERR